MVCVVWNLEENLELGNFRTINSGHFCILHCLGVFFFLSFPPLFFYGLLARKKRAPQESENKSMQHPLDEGRQGDHGPDPSYSWSNKHLYTYMTAPLNVACQMLSP